MMVDSSAVLPGSSQARVFPHFRSRCRSRSAHRAPTDHEMQHRQGQYQCNVPPCHNATPRVQCVCVARACRAPRLLYCRTHTALRATLRYRVDRAGGHRRTADSLALCLWGGLGHDYGLAGQGTRRLDATAPHDQMPRGRKHIRRLHMVTQSHMKRGCDISRDISRSTPTGGLVAQLLSWYPVMDIQCAQFGIHTLSSDIPRTTEVQHLVLRRRNDTQVNSAVQHLEVNPHPNLVDSESSCPSRIMSRPQSEPFGALPLSAPGLSLAFADWSMLFR